MSKFRLAYAESIPAQLITICKFHPFSGLLAADNSVDLGQQVGSADVSIEVDAGHIERNDTAERLLDMHKVCRAAQVNPQYTGITQAGPLTAQ